MDTERLAGAVLEPPGVPADRLYRMSPEVYRGLYDHGLLSAGDRVELADGLLVHEAPGGPADADRLYRMPMGVYEGVARHALLTDRDKVVLLDGLLVKKMPKGDAHVAATFLLLDLLRGLALEGWHIKTESPIALADGPSGLASVPEPDLTVVRGAIRDYLKGKPGPGDLALVVEVAESSLREDRKGLARYAWAGIPFAWVVNLNDRTVEVYSRPTGPAAPAKYQELTVYGDGEEVPVVVDGREAGRVAVADLLP